MMQSIVQVLKIGWRYVVQICVSVLSFTILFFLYAKYKTGKSFQDISKLYFEMISKALIFTGLLLGFVFILTEYIPTCHIVVFLLGISSATILLKYVRIVQSKRIMAIDACIVLTNIYCSYLLIMQDRFEIKDYFVLSLIAFCFFFYQQIKKIV